MAHRDAELMNLANRECMEVKYGLTDSKELWRDCIDDLRIEKPTMAAIKPAAAIKRKTCFLFIRATRLPRKMPYW
jgi:hypothetical protein